MYLLGFDIGSSSVKAALVNAKTNETIAVVQYPSREMPIDSPQSGWAEQDPAVWWNCVCKASKKVLKKAPEAKGKIKGIGIAYQMHGLVCLDKNRDVLRPSIIWCDSRAVEIGNAAFAEIGEEKCLSHLLNSPGNFTASKLKWVKENEPAVFEKIDKIMLPGDYIAGKMTDEFVTTVSGLSEGVFWDFKKEEISKDLSKNYDFDENLIPEIRPTFSNQGLLSAASAKKMGLSEGIPITYRAGDQPNNALALNALAPGEVAATGGTSGVVYGVVDKPAFDPKSRVNGFAHVNHTAENPRIGVLLCINGTGIQYSWLRQQIGTKSTSYNQLEKLAAQIPVGADDLIMLPFGNGAERVLENKNIGAQVLNLNFNRHEKGHLVRACLEGIAFSFVYGLKIMRDMGMNLSVIRVGNDNLFQSRIFSQTISNLTGAKIEMMQTTGAVGAAKAAGVGAGIFKTPKEAMGSNELVEIFKPEKEVGAYQTAYEKWEIELKKFI